MNNKVKVGIAVLTSVLLLASCGGGTVTPPTTITTGVMVLPSNPNGYTLVVRNSQDQVVPASSYNALSPGTYTATYSKQGFQSNTQSFVVTAGGTTYIYYPTLLANTVAGAYYMDANGQMVAITQADLDSAGSRFVFYAWLENDADTGLDPALVGVGGALNAPTAAEQDEVAPLNTQNVAAGYVGFKANDGKVYPVIGANVRWDILEQTGNVRFSAADDGGQASGSPITPQDINDNGLSANTYTNSATGNNARFPSSINYPLYNMTGVNTPDKSGFTWTALNHDPQSIEGGTARVRAVAYINGTEIDKQFMNKTFAPSAQLTITKTPDDNQAGLNEAKTFTITVTNTGEGPANNIQLSDVLASGDGTKYTSTLPIDPGATANTSDGFNATFDLAPGDSKTFTFTAQASAVGVYCDMASVISYENGPFGTVTPTLQDQACLTVTAPTLNINKVLGTYQNGVFEPIASGVIVDPNTPVYARITVSNNGNAPATNVTVTDQLALDTNADNYALSGNVTTSPTVQVTTNGNDGFTSAPFNLGVGASQSFIFAATGTVNGFYCDQGSFTATSNNGSTLNNTSEPACFQVASPILSISKINNPNTNLIPGSSYESVITVTNTGSAEAKQVVVKDLIGNLNNVYMNNGSGSYTISGTQQTGAVTFDNATHTFSTVPSALSLAPGQTLTVTLTSTVPPQAPAGQYCDTASYTSLNANTQTTEACVTVKNVIAEQTQLTDLADPMPDPSRTTVLSGVNYVEPASNQAAVNNVIAFQYGITSAQLAANYAGPGVFTYANTEVYYDPTPTRDAQTGAVTSDYRSLTAQRLILNTDYTVSGNGTGQQTITLTPGFALPSGTAIYVKTDITAPVEVAAGQYQSRMVWTNIGAADNTPMYNEKAESTTVNPSTTP